MKTYFYCLVAYFLMLCGQSFAQKNYTISGFVKDDRNGEDVVGAGVIIKESSISTVTNIYGFYSLSLPEGNYTLEIKSIGFETIVRSISLSQDLKLDFSMPASTQALKEVVIESEKQDANVKKNEMSTVNLKMETIKKLPALLGEVDVLRAVQLLPGVNSGGEGSTGFFVRGGGADQNLILLDEATVYNASHLLGFFSVFNQDAIKEAQLYKGGIPSQYGGRLSSVLDVRMKEGNNKRLSATGGLGTISSRLTIEGPIVKDKGSFIISGRRSYADLFLKFSKNKDLKETQLFFYDLNGKANYTLNDKNRVYLSAYTGRDVFKLGKLIGFNWGNQTFTSRWNHLFSDKLFSNLTLIASNYDYNIYSDEDKEGYNWNSRIKDYSVKNDFNYYLNNHHTLKFGVQVTKHTFTPVDVTPKANSVFKAFSLPANRGIESAAYVNDEAKFGARWQVNYGIRFSLFNNVGPGTVYSFNDKFDTTGVKKYTDGKSFHQYSGWEPRVGVTYVINDKSSVKASYNRTYQYVHLASNSTNAAPLDLWIMSSPNVKPQIADQYAIGYFRNFLNNKLEFSTEAYYKTIQHQIDFKDRANLLFNPLIEGELRSGKGLAYGLEFMIRKQQGKLNGWISYTLSHTERTIVGINNDKAYNANYNRPHNLAVVVSYDIKPRLSVSVNFVYFSGSPITAPTGRFEYQGSYTPIYSDRNAARMPDYHRLDLAVTLNNKKKREDQKYESSWVFSVYNVYNRKNPYAINFKQKAENRNETTAVMTYIFPILPAVTYNFKF